MQESSMMGKRRSGRLTVSRRMLVELMGLPKGTEIVAVGAVWHDQAIDFVLVGPELPECAEGQMLPVVNAIYQTVDDDRPKFVGYFQRAPS